MSEREIIRSIIDFSFLIKGQLKSEETMLLKSILNVVIMEAEDVLCEINDKKNEYIENQKNIMLRRQDFA